MLLQLFAKGMNFTLGKSFQQNKVMVTGSLQYLQRERSFDKNYFDKIRISTLELVSYEIVKKQISGAIAELGVYKGKFARFINHYFPDRTFYLFDTFEGFDERDVAKEKQEAFSTGTQNFADTSVQAVLHQMPFPEKCVPKKGFFPGTATGVDDKFVFVSIDADLYDPIYSGLQFFYPRLQKGGYIFVHDFNNDSYKGSRQAVEKFCQDENINFVPIPDVGGSAIITK
jgi:O-methyltransferase